MFVGSCRFGLILLCVVAILGCKGTKTPIQQPGGSSSSSGGVATSVLVINEIVTKSEADDFLYGNDWIELFNAGSDAVQVGDYMLADSDSEPYFLPSFLLAPGEYLVIAAVDSDDPAPPAINVPFKLSSEDSLSLYMGNNIVDTMNWREGEIGDGEAFGRLDGQVTAISPTPNQENAPLLTDQVSGAGAIRLSEVVTKTEDDESYLDGNDWIELVNTGSESVDLSLYSMADSGSEIVPLPAFDLAGGEYFVIAAVDADDVNPPAYNVPFKLGSDDSVLLYLDDELVDSLNWRDGDTDEGKGFGIVDDEAVTTVPTPGESNQAADSIDDQPVAESALKVNEVVSRSDDDDFIEGNDWIELYNSGSEPVDLGEFALADSDEEKVWLSSRTLAPGEYLVIAAVDVDDVAPPEPNVPFKLGSDDVVYLFKGDDLVQVLDWADDEAADGLSYGLLGEAAQSLTPTPGEENKL